MLRLQLLNTLKASLYLAASSLELRFFLSQTLVDLSLEHSLSLVEDVTNLFEEHCYLTLVLVSLLPQVTAVLVDVFTD